MNQSVSTLESHAGYWLRLVSNHVSHAFSLKVESLGVTVAEWVVMRALFDVASINPSVLAESIGLTRGAVSKLVDRLIAKGLVGCRSERADRRFRVVSLTSRGRRLVPALAAIADENDREFFGVLGTDETHRLVGALREICRKRGLTGVAVN